MGQKNSVPHKTAYHRSELTPLSIDIFYLPKEIWQNNICIYLSKNELENLRLVSRFFHQLIVTYPLWKQWIPFNKVLYFMKKYRKLKWREDTSYCIFVTSTDKDILHFSKLISSTPSFSLKELNLLEFELHLITDEFLKQLPSSLQFLILPKSQAYTSEGIYFLLQTNPSLQIEFECKYSCLYWACKCGSIDIVKLILHRNKTKKQTQVINQLNGHTLKTALYMACHKRHSKIVQLLLSYGANPDLGRIKDNYTPLHAVCSDGDLEIAKMLLQAGANPNLSNDIGHTPLILATFFRHSEIVSLLRNYGVNSGSEDFTCSSTSQTKSLLEGNFDF